MVTRRDVLKSAAAVTLGSVIPTGTDAAVTPRETKQPMQKNAIPTPAPRITRFEHLAFGMFVHWGLYSQLGKGEWVRNNYKIPADEYMPLMKTFTAKDFSGRKLAKTAKRAGMKYITLTTRHHEGFSLYDTRGLSKYDVMHSAAKRDLIKDFTDGCRAEGIVPMFYCTTLDWLDERFEKDFKAYLKYLRDSIEILCTHYGQIGGFWFDGNWSKPNADWEEDALYAVIRKHQPEAMIINNTGIGSEGARGNIEIDSTTFERGRPTVPDRRGWKKYVAGEMCHTMNFHWGIANNDFNYLSPAHVIEELCGCRRAGANFLLNVGPTATGAVPDYEAAALARVGDWIKLHGGDAGPIYQGQLCGVQGDGSDYGLLVGNDLYLFVFDLTAVADTRAHGNTVRGPGKRVFKGVPERFANAAWVDNGEKLTLTRSGDDLTLDATGFPYGTNTVVRLAKLTP